jgi:pimeloyl-ACP methyl ester carboxylesterase
MSNSLPKSIVFITGAFVGNNWWDDWKLYFESKGYKCTVPAWPHKNAAPEELRNNHPNAAIASNRLSVLIEHYATILNAFPEKPVLIGHSLGGLIVQILLQRDFAVAGIAIHSFPPRSNLAFKFSFLITNWDALGFFSTAKKSYLIPFKKWKSHFTNTMTCEQQKQSYYRYVVPESKRMIRDSLGVMGNFNFRKTFVPLLLISGSGDQIIPPSIIYDNYKEYAKSNSRTDYKEFKGRDHFMLGQDTGREDAEFIVYWLQGII